MPLVRFPPSAMKLKTFALLLLVGLAPVGGHAICTSSPGYAGPLLLRGTILSCRSAVPEIEERLERGREAHEAWAQPLRDKLPNGDRLWVLRPYDEKVANRLARVRGVIVTFAIESLMSQSDAERSANDGTAPVWKAPAVTRPLDYFLHIGGSSCDLLTDPAPTVIVEDNVCCDTDSQDSCLLDLRSASLPPT
jgi:hypothetical protein